MQHPDLWLARIASLALAVTASVLLTPRDAPGIVLGRPASPVVVAAQLAPIPSDTDLLLAAPVPGQSAATLARALMARGYDATPVSGLATVRVRVPVGTDPGTFARTLADSGLSAAVEADVRVHASRLPDDTLLTVQRPYLDAVRAPQAWDITTGNPSVLIAVVDTGVDTTHPDLAARMYVNSVETFDGRDNDTNGCVDDLVGCTFISPAAADPSCGYTLPVPRATAVDDEGHGTFVAGIAAAAGNDGRGVAGIAWDVRILPVKVLDCTATGRISDAAAGILYAARTGARVIIVAFGSASDARVLRDAVAEATDRYGALVVASVGNEGTDHVQFPAAYPGVLAVAGSGLTREDGTVDYTRLAPFTNTGPEVGVVAPAVRLAAPIPAALCGRRGWTCIEDQPIARASGTSFAAPLAAGAAALLFARHPGIGPAFVAGILRANTRPITTGIPGTPGLLDIGRAVAFEPFSTGAAGTANGSLGPPPQGPATDTRR